MFKKKIILLLLVFLVGTISAYGVNIGEEEVSDYGVNIEVPEAPINYSIVNVNSSEYWDNLDTPADISGSEFWYNHTSITQTWVLAKNYITNTVSDLVNYFTKTEVSNMISGNRTEIESQITSINTSINIQNLGFYNKSDLKTNNLGWITYNRTVSTKNVTMTVVF